MFRLTTMVVRMEHNPTPEALSEALAAVIQAKRSERGLSQREVADQIGMPHVTYHRKERGVTAFNLVEVAQVAEALGAEVTALVHAAVQAAGKGAA